MGDGLYYDENTLQATLTTWHKFLKAKKLPTPLWTKIQNTSLCINRDTWNLNISLGDQEAVNSDWVSSSISFWKFCGKCPVSYDRDFLSHLPEEVNETGFTSVKFDVIHLYINIHDLGIKAVKFWLDKKKDTLDSRIKEEFIIEFHKIINKK